MNTKSEKPKKDKFKVGSNCKSEFDGRNKVSDNEIDDNKIEDNKIRDNELAEKKNYWKTWKISKSKKMVRSLGFFTPGVN